MLDVKAVGSSFIPKQLMSLRSRRDRIAFEHPAIFPERLAEDQILTWTSPGELVYDPFLGSGTTAVIAERHNRHWIASEISAEYYNLAMARLCCS